MTAKELHDAIKPVVGMDGFPIALGLDGRMWYTDDGMLLKIEHAELLAVGWLTTELLKTEIQCLVPEYWPTACHTDHDEGWVIDSPDFEGTYRTLVEALVAVLVEAKEKTKP